MRVQSISAVLILGLFAVSCESQLTATSRDATDHKIKLVLERVWNGEVQSSLSISPLSSVLTKATWLEELSGSDTFIHQNYERFDAPTLEISWERKPEIQYHEIWIGFNSSDDNQRRLFGYDHKNFRYFKNFSPRNGESWNRINLIDVLHNHVSDIRVVTLRFDMNRYKEAFDFDDADASHANRNARAWFLATFPEKVVRDGETALKDALLICEQTNMTNEIYVDTLAAAYAETGNFKEAIAAQKQALDLLQKKSTDAQEIEPYKSRLRGYQKGKPAREW